MKIRLLILTEIISPYRIPVFNALALREDVELHVVFLAENDPALRQWLVYKDEIQFSHQTLPSLRWRVAGQNLLLNRGLDSALESFDPEVIVCGGYNYIASWQAKKWAERNQVPFLLWLESTAKDTRANSLAIEMLKRKFISSCNGFIVPGQSSREYLQSYKIADDRIFTAPNAVDNDLFSRISKETRLNPDCTRADLQLPSRYILFCGRLVREKGVFDLLDAYTELDAETRDKLGLVFAGDGAALPELQERARLISTTGGVQFRRFVQRNELARIYSLADVLALPTHSDTWGLVVNEAMACGLPIIVTDVAGCAADLVRNHWNGLVIEPRCPSQLAAALKEITFEEARRKWMGQNSRDQVENFSPHACAAGLARASIACKTESPAYV